MRSGGLCSGPCQAGEVRVMQIPSFPPDSYTAPGTPLCSFTPTGSPPRLCNFHTPHCTWFLHSPGDPTMFLHTHRLPSRFIHNPRDPTMFYEPCQLPVTTSSIELSGGQKLRNATCFALYVWTIICYSFSINVIHIVVQVCDSLPISCRDWWTGNIHHVWTTIVNFS